jgi:hypothetical protein
VKLALIVALLVLVLPAGASAGDLPTAEPRRNDEGPTTRSLGAALPRRPLGIAVHLAIGNHAC